MATIKNINLFVPTTFKKQLTYLFRQICYKAFGERIQTRIQSIGNCQYKVYIGRDLYQHYSLSGYKYSSQGTTPQQIAQDIMIHLPNSYHINSEIDQFGTIKIWPSKIYIEDLLQNIISKKRFQNLLIAQCQKYIHFRQKIHFYLQIKSEMRLRDYRIIHFMQSILKCKAIIEGSHCQKLYINHKQNTNHEELNIKIIQELQKVFQIGKIFKNRLKSQKLQSKEEDQMTKFIGCERENTILYQKYYKNFNLIKFGLVLPNSLFHFHRSTRDLNFLFSLYHHTAPIIFRQQLIPKIKNNYNSWSIGSKVLEFSDKLSNYDFQGTFQLLQLLKQNKQVYQILYKTYLQVISAN